MTTTVTVTTSPNQPTKVSVVRSAAWYEKFLYGGLSCMTAACFTNPVDVIKVRLQLQGELQRASSSSTTPIKYHGMIRGLATIAREEGIAGLQKGLTASLLREGSYSTIRMGLYEPVKEWLTSGDGKSHGLAMPLWKKIAAGGIAGATGAAIANPTDLIKVRLQAQSASTHAKTHYKGTIDAFITILKEQGIAGLYRGVGPTTQRACLLTASQLPSYDHSKHLLLSTPYFNDNMTTHFTASMIAGLVCATTTSPIDCIKSRYMTQKFGPDGRGLQYSSTWDCARQTVQHEGIGGLYKGFLPQWLRIGPHTIITFLVFEQLRKFAGIQSV